MFGEVAWCDIGSKSYSCDRMWAWFLQNRTFRFLSFKSHIPLPVHTSYRAVCFAGCSALIGSMHPPTCSPGLSSEDIKLLSGSLKLLKNHRNVVLQLKEGLIWYPIHIQYFYACTENLSFGHATAGHSPSGVHKALDMTWFKFTGNEQIGIRQKWVVHFIG